MEQDKDQKSRQQRRTQLHKSAARRQTSAGVRTNRVSSRAAQTTMRSGRGSHSRAPQQSTGTHNSAFFIFVIVLFGLVLLTVGGFALGSCVHKPETTTPQVEAGKDVKITIPEGSGGNDIAQLLVDAGVISDSSEFLSELNNQHAETNLKPGTYAFVTGEDITKVVKQLSEGPNTNETTVTIPEGVTVEKTAELVESSLGIKKDDFLAQAKASNYTKDYPFLSGAQNDSLEGFLFGKTYDFAGKTVNADSVIRAMLDQYKQEISTLDFAASETAIKSRYGVTMSDYDILTLASIIEREAVNDDDRGKVASVFYNRLQKGMPLQSDATMGYVVGPQVTADDLKKESPYNTYLNKGITPTPICSPSINSIKAALHPDDTNYYYFLLIEDGSYSNHTFSETYEQHQEAINKAKQDQGIS